MMILPVLPLIAFLLLWLFFMASLPLAEGVDWRKAFVLASLFWSAYLAIGTELLSLVRGLTTLGIVLVWVGALVILGLMQWKYRFASPGWKNLRTVFSSLHFSLFEIFSLTVIVIALLVLLITGLLSPPNIHDVLAYHMSRVMHWAQSGTLSFFATPNLWQLWMPPFTEFSQLHWYLLAGSDLLTSLPQWYSLILILVVVSAIAKLLGASKNGQYLAALFMLTVPIVVLQASGAKNDIVLSAMFAILFYYVVQASKKSLSKLDWVACGLSVSLGVLTKANFVFLALPLLLWLLVVTVKNAGLKKAVLFAAIGLLCVVLLNGGHWLRCTLTFGNPISTGDPNTLVNGRFGVDVLISNLSRNAAVQMNGKYGFVNEAVQKGLERIHAGLGLPLFDPLITLGPSEFYYVSNREEVAGNPFHFVATGAALVIALLGLIRKENRSRTYLVVLSALSGLGVALIFSFVFRWQSWSTRFFIPYYVMFAPVIGVVFGKILPAFSVWPMAFALILVLINPLLNNYSRAFSWSEQNRNSIWRLSRKGLLFANNQNIEGAVLELAQRMEQSDCREFGIIMRENAPEYVLWGVLSPGSWDYRLEHVAVDNVSASHLDPGFDPCGIVLFEVTETDFATEPTYLLAEQWKIGDVYPFSLYLKPEFLDVGLE